MSFRKPLNHKKGDYNEDIRRVSPLFPNLIQAESYLHNLMNRNRQPGKFLRIDKNVVKNPIVYADLNEDGGLVRFKKPDGFHWTRAITLQEFGNKLMRIKGEK